MTKTHSIGFTNNIFNKFKEYRTKTPGNRNLNDSDGVLNDNNKYFRSNETNLIVSDTNNTEVIYSFDTIKKLVNEINEKFKLLEKEQQKRLTIRFNEKEAASVDKSIIIISEQIMQLLRNVEENVRKLSLKKITDKNYINLRDNIKLNISNTVKNISKKIKLNQEEYMKKYKEIIGDITDYNENNSYKLHNTKLNISNSTGDQSFLKESNEFDNNISIRKKEINNLVNNINELSQIMTDFQGLVFMQGTILDRIDNNIETVLDNTIKGYEDIKKADQNLKSNCVKNSIMILIIVISIELCLIFFKYY